MSIFRVWLLWYCANLRLSVVAIILTMGIADRVVAQIIPDRTLGRESSRVVPRTVNNQAIDSIEGGARRGSSLFHSFRTFNVGEGQQVYFADPNGINNILTRVTGNDVSNILGTLGVAGGANLFLLNPNGSVFGPNARLDVRGSFLATTANGFVFPNGIKFDAVKPEAPPLLNVSVPIGLQYGKNPGAITSRAILAVDSGRSLVLAGGAIALTDSRININQPQGGRIELGSVSDAGTLGLSHQGSLFRLDFPADLERSNISLRNSVLDTRASSGGDVEITGRLIRVGDSSRILAGIASGYGSRGSQAGDITIDAAKAVRVDQRSLITDTVASATDTEPAAIGNAGDIHISTGSLLVRNGSQFDASTEGKGNGGNVIIHARDRVEFEGQGSGTFSNSGGFSSTGQALAANGSGGDVQIFTGSLLARDGSQLDVSTTGRGNAGNVVIYARDRVEFEGQGSDVFSGSGGFSSTGQAFAANGSGGDVQIFTDFLLVHDGAKLDASTIGRGNSGNVIIYAHDRVEFDNGDAFSRSGGFYNGQGFAAHGRGGDVQISTGSLLIRDRAQLDASTIGRSNSGNVIIYARDQVKFEGNKTTASSSSGGISSNRQTIAGSGRGGDVQISTGSLLVRDGAQLTSNTLGRGDAGSVVISARDWVEFDNSAALSRSGGLNSGQIIAARGRGGDVKISTGSLLVHNGAQLGTQGIGTGNAGNILLNANQVILNHGTIVTAALSSNGGNITLQNANLLTLLHSSRISTSAGLTQADGNGGNIVLNANLIAASANDDNDITANAFKGQGGAVNVTGQLAGIAPLSRVELETRLNTTNPRQLDPSKLSSNDITAISQNAPTLNGQISLTSPDVDPSRGLVELPTVPVDLSNQIAQTCSTNTQAADRFGSFIVSGKGGLPPSPTDLLSEDNTLSEWVTSGNGSNPQATVPSNPAQPIVEAQGWVKDINGEIRLVTGASAAPSFSPESYPDCIISGVR